MNYLFDSQGYGDDTSANFISFRCRRATDDTEYEIVAEPGYGVFGSWGSWSESCPSNSAVCGIQTSLEPIQGGGDDTALNDIKLFCCSM